MKNTYQIIVLGPGGVGKTKGTNTLLVILNNLGFSTSEVKPWTEAMVTTSSYVIHNFTIPAQYFEGIPEALNVVIYDLGGQFKYKQMWEMHAQDTDAIICVVDMTRKTTMRQIPLMLPKGIMEGVPVRLIVNKADLYTQFALAAEAIADQIHAIISQSMTTGIVDYSVTYKGDEKFVFNSRVYRYGDRIQMLRSLVDDNGIISARIADFEAMVASAFSKAMPGITEHNANLFGREFTLQVFDVLYKLDAGGQSMLTDDLIESAHTEAPPFISWGNDPEVLVPMGTLNYDIIKQAVDSMLIEDNDLWQMVVQLREQGYNINIQDEQSWSLTSATIYEDNPNVNYKPMHKAVLPPYFIRNMIQYNKQKTTAQEDFFV